MKRFNYSMNSPQMRRSWRRAARVRRMSGLHWKAYISNAPKPLIHNGRKP